MQRRVRHARTEVEEGKREKKTGKSGLRYGAFPYGMAVFSSDCGPYTVF